MDGLCPTCLLGGVLQDTGDLMPGMMLGPFRIIGLLGKGGMSTVYEAYEVALDRTVALKVLPPAFLHDDNFTNRFKAEARIAASLEHSHIVPVYAHGVDDGIPWMSMRLLSGGTLDDQLSLDGIGLERTLKTLAGVAAALDHAHAKNVVHRDLKPSNILFDESGRPYISDFGLARLLEVNERLTQSRTVVGTPHYMSPEQGLGQDVGRRSDIYSIGVVAYQMLTGTTPFRGRSAGTILKQHESEPVPVPPRALVDEVQFKVLKKALAKRPLDRWASATEFVTALEAGAYSLSAWPTVVVRWAWVGAVPLAILLALRVVPLDPARDLPLPVPVSTDSAPRYQVQIPDRGSTSPRAPFDRGLDPAGSPVEPARRSTLGQPPAASEASAPPVTGPLEPETRTDVTETTFTSSGRENVAVSIVTPPVAAPVVEPPAGDVITQPERIGTLNPPYPQLARAAKIQGDVLLEAVILPDGRVTQVRVLRSPNRALDNAAIRAVEQSTYKPGLRNGVPDTFTVQVTVRFSL